MGGMFSGKSTELIRRIKRHQIIGDSVLVVNSSKDIRSDVNVVKTHDGDTFNCIKVSSLNQVDIGPYDVIIIDEAQFFTKLKHFVQYAIDHKKHVILAGLDGDYKQNVFGELLSTIPMADEVTKLYALCMVCRDGTLGPFSKRCNNENSQELVGGQETYKAVCRMCL